MADLITVARPYAEAVFSLAKEQGQLDRWSRTLQFLSVLVQDAQAAELLANPAITHANKLQFLTEVSGVELDAVGRNLLQALLDNDRVALLPEIHKLYESSRQAHEGRIEATVISAYPLSAAQEQSIIAALKRRHGREVSLQTEVDAALMGGVVIHAAGEVVDGSLRGQLEQLAHTIR